MCTARQRVSLTITGPGPSFPQFCLTLSPLLTTVSNFFSFNFTLRSLSPQGLPLPPHRDAYRCCFRFRVTGTLSSVFFSFLIFHLHTTLVELAVFSNEMICITSNSIIVRVSPNPHPPNADSSNTPCTHTCMRTRTYTSAHTGMHTGRHTHTRTNTGPEAHTRTHMHARACAHLQTLGLQRAIPNLIRRY